VYDTAQRMNEIAATAAKDHHVNTRSVHDRAEFAPKRMQLLRWLRHAQPSEAASSDDS
jgi:hypothetical protein